MVSANPDRRFPACRTCGVTAREYSLLIGDVWGCGEGIVTQQVFRIKKELVAFVNRDLAMMFKSFIDKGCYIHGTYNEKFIPSKRAYGIKDYDHDFLVVGYDDNDFISVGFTADDLFKKFNIPIDEFVKGILSVNDSRININFFNYNNNFVPKLDTNRLITELEKYISATEYFEKPNFSSTIYGISSIMRLKDYFIEQINQSDTRIDKRYTRVLYEHEWILSQLVNSFLSEEEKQELLTYADMNLIRAQIIHMLGIKFECTANMDIINRIIIYINEIVSSEVKFIPKFIEILKSKQPRVL